MRFEKKEFEVQYDPKQITAEKLREASTKGGRYTSKIDGPIRARLDAPGLKLEAASSKATYAKGAKGTIELELAPTDGKAVNGVMVSVTAKKPLSTSKTKITVKDSGDPQTVSLELKVAKKAKAEDCVVVVKVSYADADGESHAVELEVPVSVK